MEIFLWMTSLVTCLLGSVISQNTEETLFNHEASDHQEVMETTLAKVMANQGNWSVEDCILLKIASTIEINPNPPAEHKNETVTMELPVDAVATGNCGLAEQNKTDIPTQTITLNWFEKTKEGVKLNRNITIEFSKNVTENKYGVRKISGVYETKQYIENTTIPDPDHPNSTIPYNLTVIEYITMTTWRMSPLEFLVPINRSYMCLDAGKKALHTELHKSDEDVSEGGIKLPEAILYAKKVQLDAFRGETAPHDEFQTSQDCTYRPNDVVPIIVGCALASLVLMVLVAYLVGRRKSRARGYQSV